MAVACLSLAGLASAASASASSSVCSGTFGSPGTLAGTYSNVTVNGVCLVDGGPATVTGNVTVTPGSWLVAAFALNDQAGTGTSSLTVNGGIAVGQGGTLVLGCEPNFSTCLDDNSNTLTSSVTVGKNVTATQPLGILMHASTVDGNVTESGGGGGVSCAPGPAVFSFGVFSDFEDNTIGGNLTVTGLQTCWVGALRNKVTNVTFSGNTAADPDSNEVVSNTISHNVTCTANSPAVQFGDSMGVSNVVGHQASGECGFNALVPNPEPMGPLTAISVMG